MTEDEQYDPAIRLEDVCPPKVVENLRDLARTIYRRVANHSRLHRQCTASCRRKGKCLYLKPAILDANAPDYVEDNLRERDMPFCMASTMDKDEYFYFRRVVLTALR